MKSLKESLLDVESNIIKGTESIKKLTQIEQVVHDFEDDLLQFITKDLCYLPGKKGLPASNKRFDDLNMKMDLSYVVFPYRKIRQSARIKKNQSFEIDSVLGKHAHMWKIELLYHEENPQQILNDILNHIEKFIKKSDKNNILKLISKNSPTSTDINIIIQDLNSEDNDIFTLNMAIDTRNKYVYYYVIVRSNKKL